MDWYKLAIEKLRLVEVTQWYVLHLGEWQFSHIESGHSVFDRPYPRTDEQAKAWNSRRWSRRIGYAAAGNPLVVHVV